MRLALPPMLPLPEKTRQFGPDVYGNDLVTYRSTFTSREPGVPQLLLVEQPEPGSSLLPHYHGSDQFQIFMDGNGRLGAHAVNPVYIHYTNRYTGYGPIVAGDAGVNYYVFRPSADPLGPGQYLFKTELKERLKRQTTRKRSFVVDALPVRSVDELRVLSAPSVEQLFATADTDPDAGTLAQNICLAPGMRHVCHDPDTGGGQLVMVLQGSAIDGEAELMPRAAIAITRGESAITLVAGDQGLQALLMQYPRWEPGPPAN
jgi:hypothetical protein